MRSQVSSGFPAQCVAMHYRQGLIILVLLIGVALSASGID